MRAPPTDSIEVTDHTAPASPARSTLATVLALAFLRTLDWVIASSDIDSRVAAVWRRAITTLPREYQRRYRLAADHAIGLIESLVPPVDHCDEN